MNIRIPHTWLLEHLETEASPEKIQEALSLCGPSVERIETIHEEPVYDIEVTTNRVDSASVRGIAREASAILPEFAISAALKPLVSQENVSPSIKNLPAIDIEFQNDSSLCKRLIGIVLQVKVAESPDWIKRRLEQVGQRPLNNLIDITNYVMWEIGHPTHIFDYDKLMQKKIVVREAKKGESFTTLDHKTYQTVGGEVVFDDGKGQIIDLPGLMGTANTVVDSQTRRVLFFVDSVLPEKIRFASMTHSIRSQAAVLNEKHVDPSLGMEAIWRGLELLTDLADAKPMSQIYDDWPSHPSQTPITLSQDRLTTYLGIKLDSSQVERILSNLGCQVQITSDGQAAEYKVTPPSYRSHDLQIPQDIIEELARIYGYHNLPSVVMDTAIPDPGTNLNHPAEQNIKKLLAAWGASEVYTYSLVSTQMAEESRFALGNHLKLSNSLTEDLVYLRRSLIPSHAEVFSTNKAQESWSIFEMANVYIPQKENSLPHEKLLLVISNPDSYVHLKQLVDSLLHKLRVQSRILPQLPTDDFPEFIKDLAGSITVGETVIGVIGQTHSGIFSAQISVEALLANSADHPTYRPLSHTSPVIEDMTFTLPAKTHTGIFIQSLKDLDATLNKVTLKDRYKQNITLTIEYLNPDVQLKVSDIEDLRKKIIQKASQDFSATLVGAIENS